MIPSRIGATTAAQLKMLFRRRITLFWSLVFPMILMTLLGLLFGRSIDAGTITVIDRAGTTQSQRLVAAVEHTDGVTVKRDRTDPARAEQEVRDGDRDAVLLIRRAGGDQVEAQLFYSNASATQAGIIRAIVTGAADKVSIAASGGPPAVRTVAVSVDSAALDYIDFLLPGILALAIMISAVIGLSTVLVDWRKRGILRRLKLTPMPLWEFFVSRIAASLALAMLQVVVLIAFGAVVFGIEIAHRLGGDPGRPGRRAVLPGDGLLRRLAGVGAGDGGRGHQRDHKPDDVPVRHLLPGGGDARGGADDREAAAPLLHGQRPSGRDRARPRAAPCAARHRDTVGGDGGPGAGLAADVQMGVAPARRLQRQGGELRWLDTRT